MSESNYSYKPRTNLIVIMIMLTTLAFGLSPCNNIDSQDGSQVYRINQLFYSMIYPNTFTIKLYPNRRCFYVVNNLVQAKWNTIEMTGTLYVYGY